MIGDGSAFEACEFVKLGRCARRAAARVGHAAARIEEYPLVFTVGGAVCAGAVRFRPLPIRVARVSSVSHCPVSFLSRRSRSLLQPALPLRRGAGWGGRRKIDGLVRAGCLARPTPQRVSGAALGGPHGAVYFPSGTKGQRPLVFPVLAVLRGGPRHQRTFVVPKARDFEKLLDRCSPRRLSIYGFNGLKFSETMEVAEMVMTGRHRRVPIIRGHLGSALYRQRVIFGGETVEVRDADRSAFGGIFGIREYPAFTTPRQFESLLAVDFGFVLTQSFTFLGRAAASERFRLRQKQLENADDRAVSQMLDLVDAADDLMSNRFVLGDHHFTLAVYSDSLKGLRDNLSIARAALADTGMVAAREGAALEAAYWSQLVGNFAWRARPAPITSLNFAAFSPFHTYPAGLAAGNHWGDAIALMKTSARSPYFFSFHKRDIGHTLVVGPTGGGKTVIVNFLMAQAEKTGARQIFIDKDRGAQIFVLASGGTYLTLVNGTPTGFAPLKALENNAEDRAWLSLWVRQLVRAEQRPITVQEERMIDEGVAAVMRLPREDRSLDALRTMLGMADASGIGARLEKWTSRGAMGWVFDNAADEMTLDARFIGFDMTDFLDNAEIRAPLMLYLFHRIDKMLTGERTIIAIDEFWKALQDEAFRGFAQDGLKTYRKRNAMMVFATQSPADALKSDIAHSILEQVATQVMLPNPKGARRDYVEGALLQKS
ncbi:MAG: hypothetical protein ACOY5R_12505 [Pseudomonadota bacterium]